MGKRVRIAGMAVLAVLVIGGCHWGTYKAQGTNSSGATTYSVTIHQTNTNDTIAHCGAGGPDVSLGQSDCALDVIRYACHADPINWSTSDCDDATGHVGGCRGNEGAAQPCEQSMRSAITAVNGSKECLAFEWEVGGPSRMWFGADSGFAGCP
jgi:hypothetical protein